MIRRCCEAREPVEGILADPAAVVVMRDGTWIRRAEGA
jgi:hypothetical protein